MTIVPYPALKEAFMSRKPFLELPNAPNQMFMADFAKARIMGRRPKPLFFVMDYYSRYLLVLKLFAKIDEASLVMGLENALEEAVMVSPFRHDHIIMLFNDELPVMNSPRTLRYIESSPYIQVRESIIGRTRLQLASMMKRVNKTIIEEEFPEHGYTDVEDAQSCLGAFRNYYNHDRPHQSLKYRVPVLI